jgi:hypothetical protein
MRAAQSDAIEKLHQFGGLHHLGKMEPAAENARQEGRHLRLEGGAHRIAETLRRLHDDINRQHAAAAHRPGLLLLQLRDRRLHPHLGLPAHTRSAVQHPVDGRGAEPCLEGDILDEKEMCHMTGLMVF